MDRIDWGDVASVIAAIANVALAAIGLIELKRKPRNKGEPPKRAL